MLQEALVLLLILVWGGLAALAVGFYPWLRQSNLAYSLFGVCGLLPMLVWYWAALGCFQALSTTPLALFNADEAVSVWAGWQYSVLLACLIPACSFSALTLTRPAGVAVGAVVGLGVLLGVGVLFATTASLLVWLISFELLLLSSLYLLRLTSKSERIGEAVAEMFFWTLAGSICLLLGFLVAAAAALFSFEGVFVSGGMSTFTGLLFLIGFGVKLPIWPCYSWLLKAHVEASVEFSILLSGVVVKFGALGLYRALALQASTACSYVLLACSTLAIIEASLRLFSQRDLKRIVALTTVIELNWVGVCLGLGGGLFEQIGAFILVAHSLTTTGEFFGVECVYRRYGTRDLTEVAGLASEAPLLFSCLFLTTLTTIGFPATSLFAAKLWFLTAVAQVSLAYCACFGVIFLLVLPVFFIRAWVPVWFGQKRGNVVVLDTTGREVTLLAITVAGSLLLGLWPLTILG